MSKKCKQFIIIIPLHNLHLTAKYSMSSDTHSIYSCVIRIVCVPSPPLFLQNIVKQYDDQWALCSLFVHCAHTVFHSFIVSSSKHCFIQFHTDGICIANSSENTFKQKQRYRLIVLIILILERSELEPFENEQVLFGGWLRLAALQRCCKQLHIENQCMQHAKCS